MFLISCFKPGHIVADHWAMCEDEAQARDVLCRMIAENDGEPARIDPYAVLRYTPATLTCRNVARITIDPVPADA